MLSSPGSRREAEMSGRKWINDPDLVGFIWTMKDIDVYRSVAQVKDGCVVYASLYRTWNDRDYVFNKLNVVAEKDQDNPAVIKRVIATWHALVPNNRRRYRKYLAEIGPRDKAIEALKRNDLYEGEDRTEQLLELIEGDGGLCFMTVEYTIETEAVHRSSGGFGRDAHRSSSYRLGNRHKLDGVPPVRPGDELYMKGYRSETRSPEVVARIAGAPKVHRGRVRPDDYSGTIS
jgi:hypothetical protein